MFGQMSAGGALSADSRMMQAQLPEWALMQSSGFRGAR